MQTTKSCRNDGRTPPKESRKEIVSRYLVGSLLGLPRPPGPGERGKGLVGLGEQRLGYKISC